MSFVLELVSKTIPLDSKVYNDKYEYCTVWFTVVHPFSHKKQVLKRIDSKVLGKCISSVTLCVDILKLGHNFLNKLTNKVVSQIHVLCASRSLIFTKNIPP